MSKVIKRDEDIPQATEEHARVENRQLANGKLSGPQTYSFRETAELFGVGKTAFWEAMSRGELPVKPLRIGGQWRFPRALVHRAIGIEKE